MVFFKKKQPAQVPQPLSPQDFAQPDDIPMDNMQYQQPVQNQYQQPRPIDVMADRMEQMGTALQNSVSRPQPMPQQVINPQTIKQAVQQPAPVMQQQVQSDDEAIRDAIIELDTRLNHIESWLFRRIK